MNYHLKDVLGVEFLA